MARVYKTPAYWAGYRNKAFTLFRSMFTPTFHSHKSQYDFCYGPYWRKQHAIDNLRSAHPWAKIDN